MKHYYTHVNHYLFKIHTIRHEETKCSWMGDPNMEKPFHCWHWRHKRVLSPCSQLLPPNQVMHLYTQYAQKLSSFEAIWALIGSMPHSWHHQAPSIIYTLNHKNASLGDTMPQMPGTLVPNLTIIDAMKSLSKKLEKYTIRHGHLWPPCHLPPTSFQCWPNHQGHRASPTCNQPITTIYTAWWMHCN